MLVTVGALAACGGSNAGANGGSADSAAAGGSAATASGGESDPTRNVDGAAGLPAGYQGAPDRAGTALSGARYTAGGDGTWEVQTGPAHVTWAPRDSASGRFAVRARFEQLEAPQHAEAFGLFVGGRDLDAAGRRYTYFVVRGTGEYLVRVREGEQTRDVQGWTAAPAVPKQDAQGRATYDLVIRTDGDSTYFLVGNSPVHAV